ncbi:MAG: Dipeptide transport system permease protein DppC, partial [uncultured Thermomicrobiales bacterium]
GRIDAPRQADRTDRSRERGAPRRARRQRRPGAPTYRSLGAFPPPQGRARRHLHPADPGDRRGRRADHRAQRSVQGQHQLVPQTAARRQYPRHRLLRARCPQPPAPCRARLPLGRTGRRGDLRDDRNHPRRAGRLLRRLGRFADHARGRHRPRLPHPHPDHHDRLDPGAEHLQCYARDRPARLAPDRPDRARPLPDPARARIHPRRADDRRVEQPPDLPPHPAERPRPGDRRRDVRDGERDPARSRPLVPGPRGPTADPLLGEYADRRPVADRPRIDALALDPARHRDRPRRPGDQLHRRRSARCPRSVSAAL